jgi:hypothetical protein
MNLGWRDAKSGSSCGFKDVYYMGGGRCYPTRRDPKLLEREARSHRGAPTLREEEARRMDRVRHGLLTLNSVFDDLIVWIRIKGKDQGL